MKPSPSRRMSQALLWLALLPGLAAMQAAQAANVTALTPYTNSGSTLLNQFKGQQDLVYVAPQSSSNAPSLCNMAISAMGDGSVVLLDLTASVATDANQQSAIKQLKTCLAGADVAGNYVLVKITKAGKRVLVMDSKALQSATDLQNKLNAWN